MAVHASHASLPYPIKNARFSFLLPYLDADGDPTVPTTPDTEFSGDNGAAADCAEEVSATSGMDGMTLITVTGAETNFSCLALNAKVASGPKATLATLYPRNLAIVGSGTLSAGSAGGGTLGTILAYDVCGCFLRTTGGTGGGGTGGLANQARRIITYTTSTGAFTVSPNWETTPDNTTTYDVLLPEGVTLGMLRTLNPTTAGTTLDVSATGEAGLDWGNVGSKTTTNALTNTTVATTQKVDVETIKTNAVVNAGTITFPTTATLASTTGAVGSVTGNIGGNVVGSVASVTAGVTLAASAIQAIWDALTSALTTAGSIGKWIVDKADVAISSRMATYTQPTGFLTTVFGATVSTQASVDDLPTNSELATALADADNAVLAAVGTPMQAGSTVVLTDASLTTAKLGAFVLTKTTNIAGFNDIAASAIVSSGAITTLGGAVSNVTTVATLTTLPAITTDWLTGTGLAASAVTKIQVGLSSLDAAGIRIAVGLASANLDTQLGAIVADTNELQTDWANTGRLDTIIDTCSAQATTAATQATTAATDAGKIPRKATAIAAGAAATWTNTSETPSEVVTVVIS